MKGIHFLKNFCRFSNFILEQIMILQLKTLLEETIMKYLLYLKSWHSCPFASHGVFCIKEYWICSGEGSPKTRICIHMADSFCCTVEADTTLSSNYMLIKFNFKIRWIYSKRKEHCTLSWVNVYLCWIICDLFCLQNRDFSFIFVLRKENRQGGGLGTSI